MPRITSFLFLFTIFASLIFISDTNAQRGRRDRDPKEDFERISDGKGYIDFQTLSTEDRLRYEMYFKSKNINSNRMTLQQYLQYSEDRNNMRDKWRDRDFREKYMEERTKLTKDLMENDYSFRRKLEEEAEKSSERVFPTYDKNNDSFVDQEEASKRTLGKYFDYYDKNRDRRISKLEFVKYIVGFQTKTLPDADNDDDSGPTKVIIGQPDPDRPKIFSATNLPEDLPEWFGQMDQVDNDGQIGLYEWRQGGRLLQDFTNLDLNNDGFLSVYEVQKWQQAQQEQATTQQSTSDVTSSRSSGDRGTFKGFQFRRN